MERRFTLQLSVKTLDGFTAFGEFELGKDRLAVTELFKTLKGNYRHADDAILFIDMIEEVNGLPATVRTISCTLDELAYNSRLIAKEVFRQKNLTVMGQ